MANLPGHIKSFLRATFLGRVMVNREGDETGPQYTFRLSELPVLHQNRPRLSISRIDSVRAALNSYHMIQVYILEVYVAQYQKLSGNQGLLYQYHYYLLTTHLFYQNNLIS